MDMTTERKVLPFPTLAEPSIDTVLSRFLKSEQKRLKVRTYRRYREVIDLMKHCLNAYGANDLESSSDIALYDRLSYHKNIDFCAIFGPEKILPSVSQFLNYFMIRKVMASEALLQAAGTVTKRLIKWLEEQGWVEKEAADKASAIAAEAARELPAAERLARLLYEYAQQYAPRYWTAEIDDYFTVDKVEPGLLHLSAMTSADELEVRVPKDITDHCRVGWQVNLLLGKTRNGWSILETGNVYPS
ncbi:MAG: hypothetical protein MUF52_11310 [Syntrophobacteraceae bacterium]|jgi:hypothetical protein|nr:hypothetical protein [Syntrophobacteraceae bacterium]